MTYENKLSEIKIEVYILALIGCLILIIGVIEWLEAGQIIYTYNQWIINNRIPEYNLPVNYQQTIDRLFILKILISLGFFIVAKSIYRHDLIELEKERKRYKKWIEEK